MMRRKSIFIVLLAIVCLAGILLFAACSDGGETIPGKDTPIEGDNNIGTEENAFFEVTVDNALSVETKTYAKGAEATVTAPAIENKRFAGWYYQGSFVSADRTYSFNVEEPCALRAVYVDEYTIYLDAGAGEIDSDSVSAGSGMSYTLEVPVLENHIFLGWKWRGKFVTDERGRSLADFNFGTNVSFDAEYKEKPTYSVKVLIDGRTHEEYDGGRLYEGTEVSIRAENLQNEDKLFDCWCELDGDVEKSLGEAGLVEQYSFTVERDVVLLAKYRIAYMVVITVNSANSIVEYSEGSVATASAGEDPVGMVFRHWVNGNDATEILTTERDITFDPKVYRRVRAVFDYIEYKLTYRIDGVVAKEEMHHYNEMLTMWNPDNLQSHKVFKGWSRTPRTMPAHDEIIDGTTEWERFSVLVIDGIGGGEFDYGATVTVAPQPPIGQSFAGWKISGQTALETGDANGVYTFTVEKAVSLTAQYEYIDYTLRYIVSGAHFGTDNVYISEIHHYGDEAVPIAPHPSLNALEQGHYDFSGWYLNGEPLYRTNITYPAEDMTITGVFTVHTHTVTLVGGTFDGGETTVIADWNSELTATAEVNTGEKFIAWRNSSGISVGADRVYTFNVSGDETYTADIEPKEYTVKFFVTDVDGEASFYKSYKVNYNEDFPNPGVPNNVNLFAKKNFSGWKYEGEEPPQKVFDADSDIIVTGSFSWKEYSVNVSNGYIVGNIPSGTRFVYGSEVTVEPVYETRPVDAPWKRFRYWEINSADTNGTESYTFTVENDITLKGVFANKTFTAEFYINTDGGDYVLKGETDFDLGNNLTASILAKFSDTERAHYNFSGWHLEVGDYDALMQPEDTQFYGEYTREEYKVTVIYQNMETGGSIILDEYPLLYNDTIELTAPDRPGEQFLQWLNSAYGLVSPNATFTVAPVTGNTTFYAAYRKQRLVLKFPAGSTVVCNPAIYKEEELVEGNDLTLKCVYGAELEVTPPTSAPEGNEFTRWELDGAEVTTEPLLKITVEKNANYTILYSKLSYDITFYVDGAGFSADDEFDFSDNDKPNPIEGVVYADAVTLYPAPVAPDHYWFDGWYVDSEYKTKSSVMFNMPARDLQLYGRFVLDKHTITIVHISETETDQDEFEWDYGSEHTLTPKSITGQHFDRWEYDGATYMTAEKDYTVLGDATVSVYYKYTKYKVTYYTADSVDGELYDKTYYDKEEGYIYGEDITIQANPSEKDLYVFGGWYRDGETALGSAMKMPAQDVEIIGIYFSKFSFERLSATDCAIRAVTQYKKYFEETLVIPESFNGLTVSTIKTSAFSGITSTKITVPLCVVTMGSGAFSDVDVEEIELSRIYGGYLGYMFGYDTGSSIPSLQKVVLHDCVIPADALSGMLNLAEIVLDGVTSIGARAFLNCKSVESLTVPSSVTSIGTRAFSDMKGLEELILDCSLGSVQSIFENIGVNGSGIAFKAGASLPSDLFYNSNANIISVELGEGVESVGANAFRGISATSLDLGSVKNIGSYAFYGAAIASLTVPETVEQLGAYAFGNTASLVSVTFEAKNASGANAFNGAGRSGATVALTLGNEVVSLGERLFAESKITSFTASGTAFKTVGNSLFEASALSSAVLPSSTVTIGGGAFKNTSITSFVIPVGVKYVGESAFADCALLTSVELAAEACTTAFTDTFAGCGDMTVTVKNNVKAVPANLFGGTSKDDMSIEHIVFESGSTCITVGARAFANNPVIDMTLGNDLEEIGEGAFESIGTSALTILLPYSVERIGRHAFASELLTIECEVLAPYRGWNENWAEDATVLFGCGNKGTSGDYGYVVSGTKIYFTQYTGGNTVVLPATVNVGGDELPVYGFGQIFAGKSITSFVCNNASVTKLFDYAFEDCTSLTSVTMVGTPDVGKGAFKGCSSLTTVNINFGSEIPEATFEDCAALSSVDLTAIETIGDRAFANSGLTNANLSSLKAIGAEVFRGCTSLASFTVGSNQSYVLSGIALYEKATETIVAYPLAASNTSYVIGDDVENIASYAFAGAGNLTSITIGESVKQIGEGAFIDCASLSEVLYYAEEADDLAATAMPFAGSGSVAGMTVKIKSGVVSIPARIFYAGEGGINVVAISFEGDDTESVGDYAFYKHSVTNLTIPSSLTSIGERAFYSDAVLVLNYNAEQIESIGVDTFGPMAANSSVIIGDGVTVIPDNFLYTVGGSNVSSVTFSSTTDVAVGENAFRGTSVTALTLDKIADVGDYAFAETPLATVSLTTENNFSGRSIFADTPSTVQYSFGKNVPDYLFYGETDAKVVTFNQTERIGASAFRGLSYTSFTLPDTLITLGEYAFAETRLVSVTIPSAVKSIGKFAFASIPTLTTVNYNAVDANALSAENGVYSCDEAREDLTINIGAGVLTVPDYAFSPEEEFERIKAINFNTTVLNRIGSYAFAGLTEAVFGTIPSSVKRIGAYAFYCCELLTSVSVDSLEALGAYAFYHCELLTALTATSTSESGYTLGAHAFDGCSALMTVALAKVTYISDYAFYNCESLLTVSGIDDNTMYYGERAFAGCESLATVNLAKISVVSKYLFADCTALDVELPDTVNRIEEFAFKDCTSLTKINIARFVSVIEGNAFAGCTGVTEIAYSAENATIPDNDAHGIFKLVGTAVVGGASVTIGARVRNIPKYLFAGGENDYAFSVSSLEFDSRGGEDMVTLNIGDGAFMGLALTDISLPSFVERIGVRAFFRCTVARVLTIGEQGVRNHRLTFIGTEAFSDLYSLETLNFHSDGTLEGDVFVGSSSGAEEGSQNVFADSGVSEGFDVVIGKYVPSIKARMFYNLNNQVEARVKSLSFEEDAIATSIGTEAFRAKPEMISLELPKSLTTLGERVFEGMQNLQTLIYNAPAVAISDPVDMFGSMGKNGSGVDVTIGKGVTYVPGFCNVADSDDKPKIKSVTFVYTTRDISIAAYAFENYYGLNMTISGIETRPITQVGRRALYGVNAAFEATFVATVIEVATETGPDYAIDSCVIGEEAFKNSGITMIYLNFFSFIDIYDSAFEGCGQLQSIHLDDATKSRGISVEPELQKGGNMQLRWVMDGISVIERKATGNLSFVGRIGNSAFKNCTQFNFDEFYPCPNYVGAHAFEGCTSLTDIFNIGKKISFVTDDELELKDVAITYIGAFAFRGAPVSHIHCLVLWGRNSEQNIYWGKSVSSFITDPDTEYEQYWFSGITGGLQVAS